VAASGLAELLACLGKSSWSEQNPHYWKVVAAIGSGILPFWAANGGISLKRLKKNRRDALFPQIKKFREISFAPEGA
jgi:hypothetical protein